MSMQWEVKTRAALPLYNSDNQQMRLDLGYHYDCMINYNWFALKLMDLRAYFQLNLILKYVINAGFKYYNYH